MVNHRSSTSWMLRQTQGADWRRRRAMEFVRGEKRRIPVDFDATTRRAVDYYQLIAQGEFGKVKTQQKYVELAAAEAIWREPTQKADIQKLMLANVDAADICEFLSIEASVLNTIEELYFDVRPMLCAAPWIVTRVINPEGDAGRDDVAAQLRLAYFGGPYAAKALIEAKLRLPTERAQQLADAAILLHAKFLQAIEMPLSPEQQTEFIRLAVEIQHQEQLLKLERERLALRMQRWTQRYELARVRLSESGSDANEKGASVDSGSHLESQTTTHIATGAA